MTVVDRVGPPVMEIPGPVFPRSTVPVTSVPMKLPCTTLPVQFLGATVEEMPAPPKRLITSAFTVSQPVSVSPFTLAPADCPLISITGSPA
jgi:hypothetical protein